MDPAEIIQRRVAFEIAPGSLVNLGIGIPTGVPAYISPGLAVLFQSENGIVGMGTRPPEGFEDDDLTDAGGGFVTAVPGAAAVDSATSFALIRGGHLDLTVLGGMQVDEMGRLANWLAPGAVVAGMGGAMDLASGARRVVVAMTHTAKGKPKIVSACTFPITSLRKVDLVVTEMAVIAPTAEGLVLRERAPGIGVDAIVAATSARLIVPADVPEMRIQA
jgi:3-oxoacid CoA-transferase B subunit